jgi:hypothetical protein
LRRIADEDWRGRARRLIFRFRGFFQPLIYPRTALTTAILEVLRIPPP